MFDFRYHALSLVAVFIALAVGLLLGVAIGDQGLVSSAEKDLRASLRRNIVRARSDADAARRTLADRQRIERDEFYPVMVADRLSAQRIGLVALGGVPDALVRATKTALDGTGATFSSVSVVGEPLDLPGIAAAAGKSPYASIEQDPALAGPLGEKIGGQLAVGGPFLGQLRQVLLQRGASSGSLSGLEGVVLVHQPGELQGPDARVAAAFEDGLVKGLKAGHVRVVGVEASTRQPSSVTWFQDRRLSSVDDLDLIEGQVALVLALAGEQGTFGVKATADALLPSVVTAPRPTTPPR